MTDNLSIRPSQANDAKVIALDDVGGVLYQVVKAAYGADGAMTLVDATNRLPVIDSGAATALASILAKISSDPSTGANQTTANTALSTISTALTHGTYGYAAGTAAATVDVPSGARAKRVSVIAGASVAATVTIAGGAPITIPAGAAFDEQIPGDATLGGDVVIGGTVQSYYVSWVA